jgi:hypothetical protein
MIRMNARRWGTGLVCLYLLAAMGCGGREVARESVQGKMFREAASSFCDEAESLVKMIESDARMAERHPQATKMDDQWLRAADAPPGLEELKPKIDKARKTVMDESGALSDIQENYRDRPGEQKDARQKQLDRIPALRAELREIRTKVGKK